ncbi:MAG: hypothetical protein JOZ80_15540 [Acidobacteriaceae bacterium]|nr:hypothetical protein [Acidobacteriaceae bacterium]
MAEQSQIARVVEKAVAQVLESHLPQLQRELTEVVLKEVPPGTTTPANNGAEDLLKAISLIHGGTTQKEILRALLECTGPYCGRAALFVMKAGAANGWQGRAFDNNDDVKDFALDVTAEAPSQVLQNRTAVNSHIADMDPQFISRFGAPSHDQILLLPLRLKDKIAALVYADGGMDGGGPVDTAALELLVAATSAWLEVASLRKQAAKEGTADSAGESAPVPVQTVSSYSDPFAGRAPKHTMAAAAAAESAEPVVAAVSGAAAAAAPARDAFAQMSPEDAEIHRKAQRFARLLTDEIKLYNQAKVAEGRKHKDVYDRLKEDIEKSRATYAKRYGNTAAAKGDYFNNEVIRSLAEDDATLMGPNFRR